MKCFLNGNEISLSDGESVLSLIKNVGVETDGLVVVIDDEVIDKALWESTKIAQGVKIEFLNFVSGG